MSDSPSARMTAARASPIAWRSTMPPRVTRLATLDIAPTREMYANTSDAFARAYWHWFFLIQPAPFPERMIGADPEAYWRKKCGSGSAGLTPFAPEALAHYLRCFADPATIHAQLRGLPRRRDHRHPP